MKTAIVIPNWNGKEQLKSCLKSLSKQTADAGVVVVDNGSSDGSVEYVKQNFPETDVVELPKNRGFAGGVNAGIKYALEQGAEYIALFNNDAVAEPDWVERLTARAEQDESIGIVTGKLLQSHDTSRIDSTGECYSIGGMAFPRGRDEKDSGQYDQMGEVFGATGGASLYKAQLFKDIGLFDEDFFAYYEDIDLSFRARLRGWKVVYEPIAVAHHEIGATAKQLRGFHTYHTLKNVTFLYTKNMPSPLFGRYGLRFELMKLLLVLGAIRHLHWWSVVKASLMVLTKLPKMRRKRKDIQSSAKVSPEAIDKLLARHISSDHRIHKWLGMSK